MIRHARLSCARAAGRRTATLMGLALLAGLAACTAPGPAPVTQMGTRTQSAKPAREAPRPERPATPQVAPSTTGEHVVARGDTLYAIAFANSLDYRELAVWNRLESPDRIYVGQTLRLTPPPGAVETRPLEDAAPLAAQPLAEAPLLRTPQGVLLPYSEANWAQVNGAPAATASTTAAPTPPGAAEKPAPPPAVKPAPMPPVALTGTVDSWLWPADGTLTGRFGAAGGKGIDITGARNAPVRAVAPGKVVYSGSGLRGYGRLLIVKHAGEFLSAYAHNESVLVKEGDVVAAGQKIALMGDSDADRVKLHFEIRRYGKPLDPLAYLPERS
ncbi:peptidoglycan DD-metalloendopeptidase family protein [Betaproteobacteria bacterium SCN1]|jgi:lipoprotein NlpD|nr:peptidoglycan DD-metalloendopeptidase family protein [Betaproteobacteria bacterium SCN1]